MQTQNFQIDIQKAIINADIMKNIFIYVLNHNTKAGVKLTKEDFILSAYRPNVKSNYKYFDFQNEIYCWIDSTWSDELKKFIFTEGRRIVLYRANTIKLKPDDFVSPQEKKICH